MRQEGSDLNRHDVVGAQYVPLRMHVCAPLSMSQQGA
jgi:hypothetical protein